MTEVNKKRKTVGLALGSGGWKGLSHVGVIKAFVENNIPIDFIAGSSVGALIGGMYDALDDIYKVEDVFNKFRKRDLLTILADPNFSKGILKGNKATKFIESIVGDVKIEDLKIPFCAVATDLLKGESEYIRKGSLSEAIRASGSIPFIFEPMTYKETFLVDGGATEMVPTEAVKKMGADIVIGVNLYAHNFPLPKRNEKDKKLTKTFILSNSYIITLSRLATYACEKADFVIEPDIPKFDYNIGVDWFLRFINEKGIMKTGEQAALKVIPQIKKLIYS